MTCYRPVTCWKPLSGGAVVFREVGDAREIAIKCGQCIGCRQEKREYWAIRCLCESKMHAANSFVTLTYDQEHFPQHGSLNHRHWQLFAKRLRAKLGPFRFFMCGEYGDLKDRPHYHALLFGLDFPDRVRANSINASEPVYRSEILSRVWPHGSHSIGTVTYASARYCAAYTTKKITGPNAADHYSRVDVSSGEVVSVVPEYARMSLGRRPGEGIGGPWLEKYWRDIYETGHNAVIVAGKKKAVPRYFDLQMDRIAAHVMDGVEYDRYLKASEHSADNTADRLAVREYVHAARDRFNEERKNS